MVEPWILTSIFQAGTQRSLGKGDFSRKVELFQNLRQFSFKVQSSYFPRVGRALLAEISIKIQARGLPVISQRKLMDPSVYNMEQFCSASLFTNSKTLQFQI